MTATSKHDTGLTEADEETTAATETAATETAATETAATETAATETAATETAAAEETTAAAKPAAAEEPAATEKAAVAEKPAATEEPTAEESAAAETEADSTAAVAEDPELSDPSDSVEIGGPPGGRMGHSFGMPRRRLALLAIAVAVALVAAGGIVAWLKIDELRDRAAAPEEARQAAMRFAEDLGTYDYRDPAGNFRLVAEQSTSNFAGQLKQITEAMNPLLLQTKATSKGSVAAAGVSSADEHRAIVVLFLDQTIENTNTKQPRVDRSRMQLTLVNVDGVWKLDHVEAR